MWAELFLCLNNLALTYSDWRTATKICWNEKDLMKKVPVEWAEYNEERSLFVRQKWTDKVTGHNTFRNNCSQNQNYWATSMQRLFDQWWTEVIKMSSAKNNHHTIESHTVPCRKRGAAATVGHDFKMPKNEVYQRKQKRSGVLTRQLGGTGPAGVAVSSPSYVPQNGTAVEKAVQKTPSKIWKLNREEEDEERNTAAPIGGGRYVHTGKHSMQRWFIQNFTCDSYSEIEGPKALDLEVGRTQWTKRTTRVDVEEKETWRCCKTTFLPGLLLLTTSSVFCSSSPGPEERTESVLAWKAEAVWAM